jgi:hypothetical protein
VKLILGEWRPRWGRHKKKPNRMGNSIRLAPFTFRKGCLKSIHVLDFTVTVQTARSEMELWNATYASGDMWRMSNTISWQQFWD